ncbi:7714_t:CDS:2 [Funneliformis geosporum]|uniref:7714_t:CDS:1 n=1 Tax=Funneliformis geosporum TaxID=1117311 RepID=A0A9W4SCZ3_9GLOM|nr:7714_t:CDS:2 [Funneliformis geosporum]
MSYWKHFDNADKKGNESNPLFETKFLESIVEKYQPKNIFSNLPQQTKFRESILEIESNLHFLRIGFDLKYKGNKKIDWVASLQAKIKSRDKNRTKTQQEEDFTKMTNYLAREHMSFI